MSSRRSFLTGAAAFVGGAAVAPTFAEIALAACGSVGRSDEVGAGFPGGLETRNGVNIAHYPFRICSGNGGTWLRSGEEGSPGARRIAWLPNGVEFSLQSEPNVDACEDGTTCGSSSPRLRPVVASHAWGYAERYPNRRIGSPAAPTSEHGWVAMQDLEFMGYIPHTRRSGPLCGDFEVHTNASDGLRISANARSSASARPSCLRRNPTCSAVNSCTEGDDDCTSAFGETGDYRDAPRRAVVRGGYGGLPYVANARSPDMTRGEAMPLTCLLYVPGANPKCYLHEGDEVDVLWRRTANVTVSGVTTDAVWYGVEVVSSSAGRLTPVGVRGWVLAYSERDQMRLGRGQYVSSVL